VSDLTAEEQKNARTALRFLRARSVTWKAIGKVLRFEECNLSKIACGSRPVTPTLAFRIAKLAKVSVDDVLTGQFPPAGTCPHCGHTRTDDVE
jgi:hypothetical protein